MQADQNSVNQQSRHNGLHHTNENGLAAHTFQLGQAEFVAHRKRDETQCSLRQDVLCLHLFHGLEANTADSQGTEAVRSKKQTGHKISSYSGQIQQFCQSGHQQSANRSDCQTNQDSFHF